VTHRTPVIACHHILSLYGHWAVNDPRGSGSSGFADVKFAPLGPIHFGRRPNGEQPTREELRAFHEKHGELLNFAVVWIDDAMRCEIAGAVDDAIRAHGYTCYACAICSNHLHLVIRTHRHKARQQWDNLAECIRRRVRHRFAERIAAQHPVISARPYSVLLFTPDEVWTRVRYVENNPLKDGLLRQRWEFVTPYDNWPLHKKLSPPP
jgi:hypothetical protein